MEETESRAESILLQERQEGSIPCLPRLQAAAAGEDADTHGG